MAGNRKARGIGRWFGRGERQQKSADIYSDIYGGLSYNLGSAAGYAERGDLSPRQAISLYGQVSPVARAVNAIAGEIIALRLGVLADGVFRYEHPALSLLARPNRDQDGTALLEDVARYWLITGNAFLLALGPVGGAPVELEVVPPQFASLGTLKDRRVTEIRLGRDYSGVTFTRREIGSAARYIHGEGNELFWLRRSNPLRPFGFGLSELSAIQSEIAQFRGTSRHNENLLDKGTRLTGVLSTDMPLDEDQFIRTKAQVEMISQGNAASGQTLLLDGGQWSFHELALSPKDMDFATLKADAASRIFANFDIPLPLVTPERMTLSNYQTALEAFYDNAVMPRAQVLLAGLSRFFRSRGVLGTAERLNVDPDSIDALKTRRAREILNIARAGVLSRNEVRAKLGYGPLDGGDELPTTTDQRP